VSLLTFHPFFGIRATFFFLFRKRPSLLPSFLACLLPSFVASFLSVSLLAREQEVNVMSARSAHAHCRWMK
jgi:hypothetical protein